jgi:hypothetical protein
MATTAPFESEADSAAWRADFETRCRAKEERSEYGRTLADARRFVKRAKECVIFVQTRHDGTDSTCMLFSGAAARRALRLGKDDEPMPCEFDPLERKLVIGSYRAIEKAQGAKQ